MTQDAIEQPNELIGLHCLNLHERYAPSWGTWECAREIYSNAIDASSEGMKIRTKNANTLEISTPTVPDVAQLFVIGCGSKNDQDENIGQFGEGLKLAALVATRHPEGSLTLQLPNVKIEFSLRPHLGAPVLFAEALPSKSRKQKYSVTLKLPGAGNVLNGKIIDGSTDRWIDKSASEKPQIYCKGVWICDYDISNALFSYNLNSININRDRCHADPWPLRTNVADTLLSEMDDRMADRLISFPLSWEAEECLPTRDYNFTTAQSQLAADAFRRKHGPNALLETDSSVSQDARNRGIKVVKTGRGLLELLTRGGIKTDYDSMREWAEEMDPVESWPPEWNAQIEEIKQLATILDVDVSLKIFQDKNSKLLGRASKTESLVWLTESLFGPHSSRLERFRTFIHEVAHVHSRAGDVSRDFENSLDLLAARIALTAL